MRDLPALSVVLLIKVTGHYDSGGHRVEHREDAYSDHQLLEFVSFGAALLDDAADPEQRHKSSQQEHRPYE